MRRIIVMAAVLALTGCSTVRQLNRIVDESKSADTPSADVVEPSVSAAADCNHLTYSASGYPEGTMIYVALGSQPPFGGAVDADGTLAGDMQIRGYDAVHSFYWSVDVGTERVVDGNVTCPAG